MHKFKLLLYLIFLTELLQATFEIQADKIARGTKVLIVDDLLATGGQ